MGYESLWIVDAQFDIVLARDNRRSRRHFVSDGKTIFRSSSSLDTLHSDI